MAAQPMNVGVVGCGNICDIYFKNAKMLEAIDVVACADLLPERARAKAAEYGIPKACSVKELLADPHVELVLNLTIPQAHYEVSLAALEAGKHAYGEKPLTLSREEGRKLLELAKARNLRVGSAPDTFLGGGLQTCRKVIDDGWIGRPVAATAFMTCHGHESWHPNPFFYYQAGGGPMFDMGPYYLTALIHLMGPVKAVMGMARAMFDERVITAKNPYFGQKIKVEVPTHVAGLLEFHNGAIATLLTTFDVWGARLPRIEVYGSLGSLSVPDPNTFGGAPLLLRPGHDWKELPLTHGYSENTRALGVADMAAAIRAGRPHRASGDLAFHVLDIMHALHDSQREGRRVDLQSTCDQPAPLPQGLLAGRVEA